MSQAPQIDTIIVSIGHAIVAHALVHNHKNKQFTFHTAAFLHTKENACSRFGHVPRQFKRTHATTQFSPCRRRSVCNGWALGSTHTRCYALELPGGDKIPFELNQCTHKHTRGVPPTFAHRRSGGGDLKRVVEW